MSAATEAGGAVITTDYVERLLDDVAKRTGFKLANDRFGFVPVALEIDRANVAAARSTAPGDDVEALRAEVEDDRFARAFREAQRVAGATGSMEPYARELSGRLRQMDKRAKAANTALADMREQAKLDISLARAKAHAAEARAAAAEAALAKARADALEEAAKIVEGFGTIALMAHPGLGATVDYALIPLQADHIPGVIRAAALTPTDGGQKHGD